MSPPRADVPAATAAMGITVAGRVAGRLVHILFFIALARLLGPQRFGAFAIGWGVVRLGSYLATLGVEQAVLRHGAAAWPDHPGGHRRVLMLAFGVSLAGSLVVAAACGALARTLGARVFGDPLVGEVLLAFAAGLPFMANLIVAANAARIGTRGAQATLAEDIVQPVCAAILALVFFHRGPTEVAWAVDASFAVALVVALRFLRRHFAPALAVASDRTPRLRGFLVFALLAGLPSRLSLVMTWGDRLLLGHYLSAADAGVYQAMSQLTMVVPMILAAVGAAVAPALAGLSQAGDREGLAELYAVSTRVVLCVCVPFALAGILLPGELMRAFYGARYAGDAAPLVILLAGQIINAATGVTGVMLAMTGSPGRWLVLSAAMTVADIGLNIALIPVMGLRGAALATSAATITLNLAGVAQAHATTGAWPVERKTQRVLLAALGAAAALVGVRLLGLAPTLALALGLAASYAAFAGVFIALGGGDDVRRMLGALRRPRGG